MPGGVIRSQHWDDVAVDHRTRRRVISNWRNWREPDGGRLGSWLPTVLDVSRPRAVPRNWDGSFDFDLASTAAPLHAFAADGGYFGARSSEHPGSWLNFRPVGCQPVPADVEHEQHRVVWRDLWNGCDLSVQHAGHKLEKVITIHKRLLAPRFRFSVLVAPGHSVELVDRSWLLVRDPSGVEVLRTRPVHGWDSATTGISPDGSQPLRCTLEREDDIQVKSRPLPVFAVVPNVDDLEGAVLPAMYDPTVVVSGTSAIEDNALRGDGVPDYNSGGRNTSYIQIEGGLWVGLLRVLASALPTGQYQQCVANLYFVEKTGGDHVVSFKQVSHANTWGEGSQILGPEVGASCFNFARYNTQAWAGSAGCHTSGVDYYASPIASAVISSIGAKNVTLPNAWFDAWASGSVASNGMRITSSAYYVGLATTEHGTASYRPTFTLDYTTGRALALPRRICE